MSAPARGTPRGYTVGDLARLAHVTVRALHHYDAIGLLAPSMRTASDYRVYSDADLARLQQILLHRDLGFALEDIARILGDPSFDRRAALVSQREQLLAKRAQYDAMLASIDKTIDAIDRGVTLSPEELFEAFGDFDPRAHEDEAKERWGHTEAYKESSRRTRRYTKDDWKRIRAEGEAIAVDYARAFTSGIDATDPAARAIAERARLHIDRWFYPCPHSAHVALGQMYVEDDRFAAHYERHAPGLAQWVCDAIRANAERAARAKTP